MRYRIDIPQFDRLVRKKTESPFGISLGRIAAGEGYDMSFDFSCDFCFHRWSFPFLPLNRCIESLFPIGGPDILYRSRRRVERNRSFLYSHRTFPILVHSKKNIGSKDSPCRHLAGLYNLGKLLALRCRQTYLVLLDRHNRIVLYVTQQRYNYFLILYNI